MTEARKREEWDHTSAILSLIANCNRDPKRQKKPFSPDDFHPFAPPKPKEIMELEKEKAFNEIRAAFKGEVILEKMKK